MPNNFDHFKQILSPYLPDIAVGAESTFNYYRFYDGYVAVGILSYLDHAAHNKAITGNKLKNTPRGRGKYCPPDCGASSFRRLTPIQ